MRQTRFRPGIESANTSRHGSCNISRKTDSFETGSFTGGTALRFLHRLPRYSEDLDFALSRPGKEMDFHDAVSGIPSWFEAEAYSIDMTIKSAKTVKSAWVRFPGLLHELDLSPRRTQVLSIKIELDSRPPSGGNTETTVVRRIIMLNLFHYDKPSLLSGKLHALLTRPYTKGRDLYDIFWYLSDPSWPAPNIPFLNNALRQTGWPGPTIDQSDWGDVLAEKLKAMDWRRAVEDVRPFLERPSDIEMMTRDNVMKLLRK